MVVRNQYLDIQDVFPEVITWHGTGIDPYSTPSRPLGPTDDAWEIIHREWDYDLGAQRGTVSRCSRRVKICNSAWPTCTSACTRPERVLQRRSSRV